MRTFAWLKKHAFVLLIFSWAAFLLLKGLDFAPLWSDEASTAWYARGIVQTGLPTAWDGKNIWGAEDGPELNEHLVLAYIPWFPYYLVAGSFTLFGETVWAARFPFALIALLSAFFFFGFLRKMFTEQKLAYLGLLLYIHTLPFLIYSRNCRYYSLLICFSSAWLWVMTNLENKKRIIALSILFTLFLHTHYFVAACFVGALCVTGLCCSTSKSIWKEHLVSLCTATLFFLPWFAFHNPWLSGISEFLQRKNDLSFLTQLLLYINELNRNLIFPALLVFLLPLTYWKNENLRKKQIMAGVVFFVSFMLCIIILDASKAVAARYVVGVIPLTVFFWTIFLEKILHKTVLQIVALGLIVITDITSLPMFTKRTILLRAPDEKIFYHPNAIAFQRLPWLGYWNTIWHDFPRNYDAAVDMIRRHVPKGACVTTYPSYHRYPLMSILHQDYEFCSQLFPKPLSRWTELQEPKLPESLFARPKTIEAWQVVFGDEGTGRYASYDELPPNSSGSTWIDTAQLDCTAGARPEFTVFQTEELPVSMESPRSIRLYHYTPRIEVTP